jgi:hypothetical protein
MVEDRRRKIKNFCKLVSLLGIMRYGLGGKGLNVENINAGMRKKKS